MSKTPKSQWNQMNVAVITCGKYLDALSPFFTLFRRFWPDCPYPVTLVSDTDEQVPEANPDRYVTGSPSDSWCELVIELCLQSLGEPILLLQEDFFLTSPVRNDLIAEGLHILDQYEAGCVRLYPCPGADFFISTEPHFGGVSPSADYRISCQAAIWDPHYLGAIASQIGGEGTAHEFEIRGTSFSRNLKKPVMSFYRDAQPWPLEYLCTAIVRGEWTAGAKKFCDEHNIKVDWSQRPFQKVC